jgi:hypothetical protein
MQKAFFIANYGLKIMIQAGFRFSVSVKDMDLSSDPQNSRPWLTRKPIRSKLYFWHQVWRYNSTQSLAIISERSYVWIVNTVLPSMCSSSAERQTKIPIA